MQGEVVELVNLHRDVHLNGKRGFVTEMIGNSAKVELDDRQVKIKQKNVYPVYCLGIPRPYWKTHRDIEYEEFKSCVTDYLGPKALHFAVAFETKLDKHGKTVHTAFMINTLFFKMAFDKIKGEFPSCTPLLRVYAVDRTQEETNIILGRQCLHVPKDVSEFAWYTDFTAEQLEERMSVTK